MTVVRIKHQENYVVISKTVLEDSSLSFKAKGLWAYCMSRPNHWEFHVSHLATVSKDGEDAIYSAIKELEEAGYVKKIQTNINGRFGPVDYEISEIKIILPQPGFPDTGFPDAGNPALVSNDNKVSNEKEKKVVCIAPPVGGQIEPSFVVKLDPEGKSIKVSLPDIFTQAVLQRKSWSTQEIHDCWKILVDYKGFIRDPLAYFEGTINNLRNKKKSAYLNKNPKEQKCQTKENKESGSFKPITLEKDSKEQRSLKSMMQEAGIW